MAGKLTKAQIYTLRRLRSGTRYMMRGDGKKGIEIRPTIGVENGEWFHTADHINAPSLPVLMRMEHVKFKCATQEPTKWYEVELTSEGMREALTAILPNEVALYELGLAASLERVNKK
ncbi:TPA: hypothetical protein LU109_003618 [Enterobacter hormaechei subsp. xiangfangensis]|nr:hypothetical protein [Enterobacter hormaechei subsp. xiangfangensis]